MQNLTPKEIVALMDKEVSGQDNAKRMLAIALRNRWRRQQLPPELRKGIKKQNVLLAGPTGSGKTALMRVIRDVLGMPVLEIDITGYSETGYQGKEVTDIPKGLERLDFEIPDWYGKNGKQAPQQSFDQPAPKREGWKREYDPEDKVRLVGTKANGVPVEILTYLIRAFVLGELTLTGPSSNMLQSTAHGEAVYQKLKDFCNAPNSSSEAYDNLQAGVYVLSRNSKALVSGAEEFIDFYKAVAKAEHMRYTRPFKEGTFENHRHHIFTNAWPKLLTEEGLIEALSSMAHMDFEQLDSICDLPIELEDEVKAVPPIGSGKINPPEGKHAQRIKEIAATYFMRAVIVGLLKEQKLDLGDFVVSRVNRIMLEGKEYSFYFENIASTRTGGGDYSQYAKLAEIGYNIMSAKPGASCYGFKSWRKNVQTLPMNTRKTCAGPNERIRSAWDFFLCFTDSDQFTDFALQCMSEMSPMRIAEVFTANAPLDYKPFEVDVDAILEAQRRRLDGYSSLSWNAPSAPQQQSFGSRHDFIQEYGVIFIDEIDKIVAEADRKSDVSREGVQRSLLKVVEGGVYGGFDTTNILFVAAGAFSGKHPSQLMPELLGRFPLRATLKLLTKEDISAICAMEHSEFMAAVRLVEIENVKVHYDQDTFDYIAEQVCEVNEVENTGARRIGSVVEHIFSDVYFEPETYLENGYDIRGEVLRKLPLMEAVLAARELKEAKAKFKAEAEAASNVVPIDAKKNTSVEPEPQVEAKGK